MSISPAEPFAPTWHDPVDLEAIYVVDPAAGGRKAQGAWLLLPDGKAWIVSYRPDPALFPYVDKRVVVHGRPFQPSPLVAAVGGMHFELETIALAAGEVPYDPVPTALPAPPLVATAAELAARARRWAMVAGRLTAIDGAGMWRAGTFTLTDGTAVPVSAIPADPAWDALIGAEVTLLARVGGDPLALEAAALCAGADPRCGMM